MTDKAKILVVDDEPLNIKLLEANLLSQGYDVVAASSGHDALKILDENDIDLVLLDVMMPGLDGIEVAKRIRANEKTSLLPIVLVTSLRDISDRIKGIEAGSDDFISKPFDKEELLARVKSLLRIKYLHEQLRENYRKLKSLEEMKDSLTHMIVHDLNNPLAIIFLKCQILADSLGEKITASQKEDISDILVSARELKRMIGNILDINKMEEGRLALRRENFSLTDLAAEVAEEMKITAGPAGQSLSAQAASAMPEMFADKDLIRRAIINLVSNALKFTPEGGHIDIISSFDPASKKLRVEVKDNGIGIPQEYLQKIFDKFFQINHDQIRAGRGLGLTFCRLVVEAHGGSIWVESREGKGSAFIFTI